MSGSSSNFGCTPGLPWHVVPNAGLSGIGIRVSIYVQGLLLCFLAARSTCAADITPSLGTLVITNLAICATTLLLSLRRFVTLYDGLMVCYLLFASWLAIAFALAHYKRYKQASPFVRRMADVQAYCAVATALAIFGMAPTYGQFPECNSRLSVVLFAPFSAVTQGRYFVLTCVSLSALYYTAFFRVNPRGMTVWKILYTLLRHQLRVFKGNPAHGTEKPMMYVDRLSLPAVPPAWTADTSPMGYLSDLESAPCSPLKSMVVAPRSVQHSCGRKEQATIRGKRTSDSRTSTGSLHAGLTPLPRRPFEPYIDGRLILVMISLCIVSIVIILNIELLRYFNHPADINDKWGFGQVLCILLVVPHAQQAYKLFHVQGLGPRRNRETFRKKDSTLAYTHPSFDCTHTDPIHSSEDIFFKQGQFSGRPFPVVELDCGARIEEIPDEQTLAMQPAHRITADHHGASPRLPRRCVIRTIPALPSLETIPESTNEPATINEYGEL